jgi:hypothetical protein
MLQKHGLTPFFSRVLQLVHKRTNKYLSSKEGTFDDGTGSMLRLEKTGSKRSWFKVMPAQKGRSEGEKVHADDKLLLFNVVAGSFLHQSKSLDEYGHYDLDLEDRHNTTFWKLQHSDVGGSRHRAVLRHGDPVRFFHPNAGYLYGTGDYATVKCKYYHAGRNEIVAAYKSMWIVESQEYVPKAADADEEDSAASWAPQGQNLPEIQWGKGIRLRLFGTDQYLCVGSAAAGSFKAEDETSAPGAGSSDYSAIVLTANKDDSNTVFHFATPGENDEITFGSETLLQCQSTKDWVHVNEDAFGYSTDMKGYTDCEIYCTKKYSLNNVFAIKMVPKYQIDDYDFVAKRHPTLQGYCDNVTGELFSASQTSHALKEMTTVLSELVKYCTVSDNDNAFEREGVPIPAHQKLLSKTAFLKLLAKIAMVGPKQDVSVTQLTFRVLKQIAKNNAKFGTVIYSMLKLDKLAAGVEKDLEYWKKVPIAQTFYEIYHDNNELLYSITKEQITHIFTLVSATRDYHYLELLAAMCRYKGSVIHNNQKMIGVLLSSAPTIIPVTKYSNNSVEIKIHTRAEPIYLLDFVWNYKEKGEVHLFFWLLQLYCELCADRNFACINILTKELKLDYEECFANLKEQQLEPRFRAAYCRIMMNIFIDIVPQSAETTALKRVWYRQAPKEGSKMSGDPADVKTNRVYMLEEDPNAEKTFKYPKPSNIQEFLLDYIFDQYNFRMDRQQQQTGQPRLLGVIMTFARMAFEFGFFKKRENILMPRFAEVLDIDPDRDHTGKPRQLPDEFNKILTQIKHDVLSIVERYFDMQDNTSLSAEIKQLTKATEEKVKRQMHDVFRKRFESEQLTWQDPLKLSQVLLRILRHDDSVLTSRALGLLKRLVLRSSNSAVLLKLLPRIQILTKKQDMEAHGRFEMKLVELAGNTCMKLRESMIDTVLDILEEFTQACVDSASNAQHQKMFFNMKAHEEIINIIRRPLEPFDEKAAGMVNLIIIRCYYFLREFCANNRSNQEVMFDNVEFMINQLILYKNTPDVPEAIMETIVAIFKDNIALCRRVTERIVLPFINIIYETKYHSSYVYMDFFRTIIKPAGVTLKSNQNIVLKLLVSMKPTKDLMSALKSEIATKPPALSAEFIRMASTTLRSSGSIKSGDEDGGKRGRRIDEAPMSMKSKGKEKDGKDGKDDGKESSKPDRKKTKGKDELEPKEKLIGKAATALKLQMSSRPSLSLTPEQMREETRSGIVSLLALCSEERNYFTEQTCQKLMTIEDCLAVCHAAAYSKNSNKETAYKIISAYLHFIDEVYLNTESSSQALPSVAALAYNNYLWDLLRYFCNEFKAYSEAPVGDALYEEYLFESVMPFMQHFFSKFSLFKANSQQKTISTDLMDTVIALKRNHTTPASPRSASSGRASSLAEYFIVTTLKVLFEAGIQASNNSFNIASLPRTIQKPLAATQTYTDIDVVPDKSVMSKDALFFEELADKVFASIVDLIQTEERDRAVAWRAQLTAADATALAGSIGEATAEKTGKKHTRRNSQKKLKKEDPASLNVAIDMSQIDYQTYLDLIVAQIRKANTTKDDKLTRICLRIVRQFISSSDKVDTRKSTQDLFAELDTPLSVIRLLRSSNMKVVADAMTALRALLDEGYGTGVITPSKKTLDNISHAFSSGGHQQFFEDVLNLIQQSKSYLKEMKRKEQTKKKPARAMSPPAATRSRSSPNPEQTDFQEELVEMTIDTNDDGDERSKLQTDLIDPGRIVRDLYACMYLLAQGFPIFKTLVTEIVRETVLYLKVFESIINPVNIDFAIQLFVTLKELIRRALGNQQTVLASQVLIPVNRLLSNSFIIDESNPRGASRAASKLTMKPSAIRSEMAKLTGDSSFYERSFDLKISVVDFLFLMIDDAEVSVVTDIVNGLSFPACTANTAILTALNSLKTPEQKKKAILLASSTFRLIKMLADRDPTRNGDLKDNLRSCENYCASRIGTVEVLNGKDLANIYFPIPTSFRPTSDFAQANEDVFLRETKAQEDKLQRKLESSFLDQDLNYGKSSEKVEALIRWIEEILMRREYKEGAREVSKLYSLFSRSGTFFWYVSYFLALVINILILVFSRDPSDPNGVVNNPAVRGLGVVQCIFSFLMVSSILLRRGSIRNRLRWMRENPGVVAYSLYPWPAIQDKLMKHLLGGKSKRKENIDDDEDNGKHKQQEGENVTAASAGFWYLVGSARHLGRDFMSIFSVIYFIFAILGVTVSPYFYCLHLFQIVVRSSYLKLAVTALYKNVVTIFLLLVMLVNGVYVFSIFSFLFFQSSYDFANQTGTGGAFCNTLWECTFTNLYYGVPVAGGLIQFFPALNDQTDTLRPGWLVFQVLFFFYVGPIVLNMVLAVIVDTFGDLRDRNKEAKDQLGNTCIICSIERDTFQQRSKDFTKHLEKDHNRLHYLYFFSYLKERNERGEVQQLSQLEHVIFEKIMAGKSVEIFPIGRSLTLETDES